MAVTGYNDTFNRTVAGGWGTADSGQAYTLNTTATQYSVAPGTASLAIAAAGNPVGLVNVGSGLFVDISGRVAISSIPASNLATVGFVAKAQDGSNWYAGSLMVATGGAMSIRFSKDVTGGLVTLTTVALGITYVANTFYNLRFQVYWSRPLQTNVLSAKVWALNATEPGGWQAVYTADAAFTDYTAGQLAGLYGRDESTTVGTITTKWQNVVMRSYNLPMVGSADPMCADPAITYPKQTSLQSLATAADTAMAAIDPLMAAAALYPRVRISKSSLVLTTSQIFITGTFDTTEFNISTPTNLGYDNTSLYLSSGIWAVTFELWMANSTALNFLQVQLNGGPSSGQVDIDVRTPTGQTNDHFVGGTGHFSTLVYVTNPAVPSSINLSFVPANTATTYTITYMALSAVKISDYFS